MKFNVNVELTDDEIKSYAEDIGRRLLFSGLGKLGEMLGGSLAGADPQTVVSYIQRGMMLGLRGLHRQSHARPQAQRGPFGPPPDPYAHCAQEEARGPFGPPPGPYAAQPGNVRPIREEPVAVEHCFPIEATRHMEAGIGCCRCATCNNVTRTTCRHCGHKLCVVVPPPNVAPEIPPGDVP